MRVSRKAADLLFAPIDLPPISEKVAAQLKAQEAELNQRTVDAFYQRLASRGIPKPEKEYKFHPDRRFRFDYAWPEYRVALEVQGGIFGRGKACPACKRRRGGAHSSVNDLLRDMERNTEAAILGWRLLFCLPDYLCNFETVDKIQRALRYGATVSKPLD